MPKIDSVIIPARGGSKRIKHKNLRDFLGKPMILRAIEVAKSVCDNIIVSSDSDEILQIARDSGTKARLRECFADDTSTTLQVMKYVLENEGIDENAIVLCLYPTAMFATTKSIESSLALLSSDVAYVVPVVENAKVFRSFECREGRIEFLFRDFVSTRTQDLPKCYCDSGQFYLGYARNFLSNIPILSNKSAMFELPFALDIDREEDLAMAEALYSFLKKTK